ncbi:hypothetical protein IEE94_15730 [Yimella sp. cx-573]|nr:hypothetical protein [Yimella sp. cx-573]
MAAIASHAIEEHRIEKALPSRGYPIADACEPEALGDLLHTTNYDLIVHLYDPESQDVKTLYEGVMRLVDRLTKPLAYLAAFDLNPDQTPWLERAGQAAVVEWNDYIHSNWQSRVQLYSQIPPADQPLLPDQLQNLVTTGIALERDLIAQMGFTFEGTGDAWGFHRTPDRAWEERDQRAQAFEAQLLAETGTVRLTV